MRSKTRGGGPRAREAARLVCVLVFLGLASGCGPSDGSVDGTSAMRPAMVLDREDSLLWSEQSKLLASDGEAVDRFGYTVSLGGETALVGAPWDDEGGADSGAAYVFTRDGTSWTQQQKLIASDGASADLFGSAVSLCGEIALVGAPGANSFGPSSGAAYAFVRDGTSWTQQQKLTASDGEHGDWFGYGASLSGQTALVGATFDDDSGADSGAAYVFVRDGTSWTQQQKLSASDGAAEDYFGRQLSLGDGTALLGASQDDDSGADAGSAYVFVRDGTSWTQQQKLLASDGEAADQFGRQLSLSGEAALLGSRFDDDSGTDSGSAYVFVRCATSWTQHGKLTASDGAALDLFGFGVSLDGSTAGVGARLDDDSGTDSGSVYVFTVEKTPASPCENPSQWGQRPYRTDRIGRD